MKKIELDNCYQHMIWELTIHHIGDIKYYAKNFDIVVKVLNGVSPLMEKATEVTTIEHPLIPPVLHGVYHIGDKKCSFTARTVETVEFGKYEEDMTIWELTLHKNNEEKYYFKSWHDLKIALSGETWIMSRGEICNEDCHVLHGSCEDGTFFTVRSVETIKID